MSLGEISLAFLPSLQNDIRFILLSYNETADYFKYHRVDNFLASPIQRTEHGWKCVVKNVFRGFPRFREHHTSLFMHSLTSCLINGIEGWSDWFVHYCAQYFRHCLSNLDTKRRVIAFTLVILSLALIFSYHTDQSEGRIPGNLPTLLLCGSECVISHQGLPSKASRSKYCMYSLTYITLLIVFMHNEFSQMIRLCSFPHWLNKWPQNVPACDTILCPFACTVCVESGYDMLKMLVMLYLVLL